MTTYYETVGEAIDARNARLKAEREHNARIAALHSRGNPVESLNPDQLRRKYADRTRRGKTARKHAANKTRH